MCAQKRGCAHLGRGRAHGNIPARTWGGDVRKERKLHVGSVSPVGKPKSGLSPSFTPWGSRPDSAVTPLRVTRMGWKLDQADSLEIYTLLLLICTCQLRRAGEAHEGTGSQQHGFISSVKVGVERIQVNFALPGVNGTWDGNPPLDVSWGCRLMMFSLVQYLVPPLHV
ncbi:hypothetical protein Anapl_03237 [Anas platyrhynchos]|uniref:Uncharacterized protein n=1 Tax=Anas platyrhynchos TaxID=8839 RepID=R0LWA0_ANAPL|nr:hypothetical protein Anapl_03237 [Anas platyrhynchos]